MEVPNSESQATSAGSSAGREKAPVGANVVVRGQSGASRSQTAAGTGTRTGAAFQM